MTSNLSEVKKDKLEDYYEMALRCNKCGFCRHVQPMAMADERFWGQCPPGQNNKYDSYFASGLLEISRAVVEGNLKITDKVLDILHRCTTCGFCEEFCEPGARLKPLSIIMALRERCIEEDKMLKPHREMMDSMIENMNPYGQPRTERLSSLPEVESLSSSSSDNLLYFGCCSSYKSQEIAKDSLEILTRGGLDISIDKDEICCGLPGFSIGAEKVGLELLKKNIDRLNSSGVKRVVFVDPQCQFTFAQAKSHGIDLNFELQHISQTILGLVDHGSLTFSPLQEKITYHDPCYLGRRLGIYEDPRKVLSSIPGVTLLEMPRSRANSYCCGAGGGVSIAFPDETALTSENRFEEAASLGVKSLVTCDPLCFGSLEKAANGNGIEVYDLSKFLLRVVEER